MRSQGSSRLTAIWLRPAYLAYLAVWSQPVAKSPFWETRFTA